MPPRRNDDVDWRPVDRSSGRRSPFSRLRSLPLIIGFVLAAAATLAVFLTDNAQYLRIAVVAVAWAFVLASFAAGRRRADRVAAAAREDQLHRSYEYELSREAAARREFELEVENEIRRETEDSVRDELDALRDDIASLTGLRDDLARVSEIRGDLQALGALRDDVARVAALRDDVAALASLRGELGQLTELRADMGRLRAELVEQLAAGMRVERITMLTQASRVAADQGRDVGAARTVEGTTAWAESSPPRELTGGRPAARLDEPHETRHYEPVQPRETAWDPSSPSTTSWPAAPPPWSAEPSPATPSLPLSSPPERPDSDPLADKWSPGTWPGSESARRDEPANRSEEPRPSRWPFRSAAEPAPIGPPTETQQPIEWLAARSLLDARAGDTPAPSTTAYTVVTPSSSDPAAEPRPTSSESVRVSEILADNGVSPAAGGRRRRRYRDDENPDDVLSRLLGRN